MITKIQNNCGFDHDITNTILLEIERQVVLIQNLDRTYLEQCGEEDLEKDIAVSSDFYFELNQSIARVKPIIGEGEPFIGKWEPII